MTFVVNDVGTGCAPSNQDHFSVGAKNKTVMLMFRYLQSFCADKPKNFYACMMYIL